MNTAGMRLERTDAAQAAPFGAAPMGRILMDTGALTADALAEAMALHARSGAPIEDEARAAGLITDADRVEALARHHAALRVDLDTTPPDDSLAHCLDVAFCLEHRVVPWARIGDAVLVATAYPDRFDTVRDALRTEGYPVIMGVASEADIYATLTGWHQTALREAAETAVPDDLSCRALAGNNALKPVPLALGLMMLAALVLVPHWFFAALAGWAVMSLLASAGLKLAAFAAHFQPPTRAPSPVPLFRHRPTVSILVPLFRETEIAATLIERLRALSYPKALLDVVLVLEEDDIQTRDLIAATDLPPWMRAITVPQGAIKTKPRAMNYALNFCTSEIIGIYDAEDWPEADQIDKIADHFATAPDEVACVQGILDFYNPKANWLSRCFAIEYATWFRVILPGLSRLGFAIPLGGTTVFFRSKALREVHGWDAHNVTEDADLGIRLARFGYRTELVASVTREEACNRLWPWVRQRSRWLKGYMVTYFTHMQHPVQLWRDLRPWKFFGFQIFFLSTLSQFLMAPILWSFWIVLLGFAHPLESWISLDAIWHIGLAFLLAEITSIGISSVAVARTRHRGLVPWVPTLMFYFPLGCAAAYKGLFEILARPFYWDKTAHGRSAPTEAHMPNNAPL